MRLAPLLAALLASCAPSRGWLVANVATHHWESPPPLTRDEQYANAAHGAGIESDWNEWNYGLGWEAPFRAEPGRFDPFVTGGVVRNSFDVWEVYGGVGYWYRLLPGVRIGSLLGVHAHERLDEVPAGPLLVLPLALELAAWDRYGVNVGWIPGDEGGVLVFQLKVRPWL